MISSMTGYGDAEGQLNGVIYTIEVRAVNNRYFKAKIKLPDSAAFLEEEIEGYLQRELSRGFINYTLRLKNISSNALFEIDETSLRGYMERLNKIIASIDVKCSIDVGSLLTLPGIVQPVSLDEEKVRQMRQLIMGITQKATDQLKQMRMTEGAALAADLKTHYEAIHQNLEQVRARSIAVLPEYQKKLKKRVNDLLADAKLKLDEETLAREVAILADRSDISEEIARMDSHLQQFAESCQTGDQAGRRLEFISQEMLRETNTIASKASDVEITRCIVDMKCWIDRIKEQVQNIQ